MKKDEDIPTLLSPDALGEPASPERVERIWQRLEGELPARARRSDGGRTFWLAAAALGVFAGGVAFGVGFQRRAGREAAVVATGDLPAGSADVLAAGSEERSFELPGGTRVSLAAQSLVEVVRGPDGGLTLRLLHGEASVDAQGAVAMLAGDARLAAPAGAVVRVRRSQDEVDVSVSGGRVEVVTPSGAKQLTPGERGSFQIHAPALVARVADDRPPPDPKIHKGPKKRDDRPAELQVATSIPEWRVKLNQGDSAGALALLRSQPGGLSGAVAAANRADLLMDLADLARSKAGGDPNLARQAYERVVKDFATNAHAGVAAHQLAEMYRLAGNLELERQYREKASLALADRPAFADVQDAFDAGRLEDGRKKAGEYLAKFPKGLYREQVQALLDEHPADADKKAPPADEKKAAPEKGKAEGPPAEAPKGDPK